jgi:hypothetical protein
MGVVLSPHCLKMPMKDFQLLQKWPHYVAIHDLHIFQLRSLLEWFSEAPCTFISVKADQPLPPLKNRDARPQIGQLCANPTLTLCQPCAKPCANLVPSMGAVFWKRRLRQIHNSIIQKILSKGAFLRTDDTGKRIYSLILQKNIAKAEEQISSLPGSQGN